MFEWIKAIINRRKRLVFTLVPPLICVFIFCSMTSFANDKLTKDQTKEERIYSLITEKDEERELAKKLPSGWGVYPSEQDPFKNNGFLVESSPTTEAISYKASNNNIEPHILDNGEMAVYYPSEGELWNLEAGESLTFKINADRNYYLSTGWMVLGYIYEENEYQIEKFRAADEVKLKFTPDKKGEYCFFLRCVASDPIIIKDLNITKLQ